MTLPKRRAPSANAVANRRKTQQKARKQKKRRATKEQPSWAAALKRKYLAQDRAGGASSRAANAPWSKGRGRAKPIPAASSAAASDAKFDDYKLSRGTSSEAKKRSRSSRDGEIELDENGFPIHDDADGFAEVQDEVDETKVNKLNEKNPLENQLFLTGIPSTVSEASLRSYFARFGAVKKVFVVMDKVTKRPSGSAFVHFSAPKSATEAFAYASAQARELAVVEKKELMTGGSAAADDALSRHKQKSLLYAEKHGQKFTLKDPFVLLDNSRVSIHRVVSRMEAEDREGRMKKEKEDKKKRTKSGSEDPRNLYLVHEGEVQAGTPAAEGLAPRYLSMLEASYRQRRESLRNVNMFVSKTRLSIRNLPRNLKEPEVRKILLKEVRKFYKVNPEMLDKSRFGKHGPLKNLTILTDAQGASKGFGFAEFVDHEAALWVLRRLNNNPTLFGQHQRLIIGFAVENVNAIQKRERIRDLRLMRSEKGAAGRKDE